MPSGLTVRVGEWDHLLKAAHAQGLRWPNMCGGGGTCRKCVLSVLEGTEHLSKPTAFELQGLASIAQKLTDEPKSVRLACMLRTKGDLVVKKEGVGRAPLAPTPSPTGRGPG